MEEKNKIYEYGAMSSRYSVIAKNKLTAYATMVLHYDEQAFLVIIYKPDESKKDQWLSIDGTISDRLDKIFGGAGLFEKYLYDNIDEIKKCYKTIKQLI